MNDKFLRRRDSSHASALESGASGLAGDVFAQISRRIGTLGLVYAGLWIFGVLMRRGIVPFLISQGVLPFPTHARDPNDPYFYAIAAISIAASLGLFVLARRPSIPPSRMIDIALLYFLGTCLLTGLHHHTASGIEKGTGLSWSMIWILMFAMFVPAPPRKMLPVLLLGASVDPLARWFFARDTVHAVTPFASFFGSILNYLIAIVGVVHAKVVLGLTRKVGEAREMGSYRLQNLLGRGGMGEVWRASHRMLARPAAVKLIRPEMLDVGNQEAARMILQRFEREAQATAALNSPHTVELFDFGISADGTFYYVMELLEGLDLDSLVNRFGPLPAERTIFILRQVCHSLADAHASGLVHRDIKPANIYVCRKGLDHDFGKVLDFGLVKSGDGALPGDALETRADLTTGTPAFLSPEAALGEGELDGRADLYAVGCVAYWMLSGQLVFDAASPMKMVLAHARDAPLPLGPRCEIPIPAELERIVMSCLEKDRDRRPATAEELLRALAAVPLERAWGQEEARRWWETHLPSPEEPVEPEPVPDSQATYLHTSSARPL